MKSADDKFNPVIKKNTFYFVNQDFEQRYEGYINSIRDKLLLLKNQIDRKGLDTIYFENLLREENGLVALLALTGFSNESFKRILTVIRVLDNDELNQNLYLRGWNYFEQLIFLYKLFKDLKLFEEESLRPLIEESVKKRLEFNTFNLESIECRNSRIRKELIHQYKVIYKQVKNEFKLTRKNIKSLLPQQIRDKISQVIDYIITNATIEIEEWTDDEILYLLQNNESFLKGIVNLFYKGSTLQTLVNNLPLFELKKLSISKLSFRVEEIIDSLVRYKEKGSYSGNKENNAEIVIEKILEKLKITWETGDLKELIQSEDTIKRSMDFIIPSKNNPKIIVESSFLVTTSSGQGDKSKIEIQVKNLISKYYPNARFVGFVDGVGWYVRKGDLRRMVETYQDVFTYHKEELGRFEKMLKEVFSV